MTSNDHLAGFLVTRLCRESGTFLDIGAHIGSIISEVSCNCPSARIVAFEAIPEKVEYLRKKYSGIEIHSCALGNSEGKVTFFINTQKSGYSSLGRTQKEDLGVLEIQVPMKSLDSFGLMDGVDVIKIDVEGAELGVMQGGKISIEENRPTIMFESGPQADDGLGFTKESLWRWLTELDYAVLIPNRLAHNDPGIGEEGFLESHLYPRRTTNYFAVAKERRTEIRDRARNILGIS